MRMLIEDLRYGFRLLRKSPAFTAVAVLTLALGIGANTAIYTLLDQALLRPLPVKDPGQLVVLRYAGDPGIGSASTRTDVHLYFSYPMYRDLRDRNSVFSDLIATDLVQAGVEWHKHPELDDAELVSGNYFDALGLQPAVGRLFVRSDDLSQNANPVVVLSFSYWQRRFGLDANVVNQSVSINGHPFTIIGVAPPGFHSIVAGDNPAVFVPMMMKPEMTPGSNDLEDRRSSWLNIAARLQPGFSPEHAQAGIAPLWHSIRADELQQMRSAHPDFYGNSQRHRDAFLTNSHLLLDNGAKGIPIHGTFPPTLIVVMVLSGLLALMACANIASLLLVRVAVRVREISVRYALGAQRRRVLQQLFSEGLLLGFLGGTLGLVLASPIAAVLIRMIWTDEASHLSFTSHPDLRVFAVVPALKGQMGSIAGGSHRLRRLSVVSQLGLSFLLLVSAGLFVRTLRNLESVDLGLVSEHLLTFSIDPALAGYPDNQAGAVFQRVLDKLRGLPGVLSAAGTSDPEVSNNNSITNITFAGYQAATDEDMQVEWEAVSPSYLNTIATPLLAGRPIAEHDAFGPHKVALVNENLARRFFQTPRNAVGQYLCKGAGNVKPNIEIIGVFRDLRHTCVRCPITPTVLIPYQQATPAILNMTFYVRTWQDPKSAESTIRETMRALDSKLVLDQFRTMQEQVDETMSDERAIAFLATAFGLLAALMAAIGIYGVLEYSIAQRTREIGLRVAVGATRAALVQMVLRDVLTLTGIGIAAAIPLSLLLAHAARAQLFGVSQSDPVTLSCVSLVVFAIAVAAAAVPAYRATRVDPIVALRYE
jgi:putative ABC transport system permease protein